MRNELRDEVTDAIKRECADIGFEKRANLFFTKTLTPDTIGVLAFNVTKVGNWLISPSVAVRHQPLEGLLAELAEEKFHPYLSGTLVCPLGGVPPLNDLLWFELTPNTDPLTRISEMMSTVKTAALPWMERHSSLDAFVQDLKTYRFGDRDSVRLRLPLAHYLNNNDAVARTLLIDGLKEIENEGGPVSEKYRRVAERLLTRMIQPQ